MVLLSHVRSNDEVIVNRNEAYALGEASSMDRQTVHSFSDFEGEVQSEVPSTIHERFSSQESLQYQNIS